MRWFLVLSLLWPLFQVEISEASSLAFSRNARTFETQHSSLVMKGLANACLTLENIPDALPCNPAMTPLNQRPKLGLELQLSNGYAALNNVQKLLNDNLSQEVIDSTFSDGKIIQIEANADIRFQSKYLNGVYSPFSVKGFSVVRNEANPDVEISAIQENGFHFQSGYELFPNFYTGLQIRALNRKLIKQRFKLAALATQAGKDLLKPKEQNVTFIEPGLSYFFKNEWASRVSLLVVNSGFFSERFDEMKEPVEAQFGVGISPPLSWGKLDLTLDYRSMTYEEEDLKKFRLGALYHFGSMYLMGGIDSNGISGGVFSGIDKFDAGILFSTTQLVNEGESFYTQTVYVQLGWQI